MPAITTIAIADGKATPITHTFSPQTTTGTKAEWNNRSAVIPKGYENLQATVVWASQPSSAHRAILKMVLPTVEVVNAVNTVTRISGCELTFNFSQNSTAAERKDLRVLARNLLADASVVAMLENIEPAF